MLGVVEHVRMQAVRTPTWRPTFLREWREARGKTLEEVAPKMGITHGQLSKIERGKHPYSQNILEVAAEEYDCTVQDLLTRRPDEAENIFARWPILTEQQKRQAIRLLNAVISED